MIRKAELKDIPEITKMVYEFFSQDQLKNTGVSLDEVSLINLISTLIKNEKTIVLVGLIDSEVVACIAGSVMEWMFNCNEKVLYEIWWYVRPEARGGKIAGKIINKFRNAGKEFGCSSWIMATSANKEENKVELIYKKMGLKHLEQHYIGKI